MLYLNVLIANLKKVFTTIHLLDIEKYEKLAFSLYRSKKIYLYINKYKTDIINENYSINEILVCGKYLSQFKISLIYLLKNKTNDENFNNLFKKQVYKYYFKLSKIAFMFIIGQMYDHFSNENPVYKKDIPYSKFKDKTNLSKIPLYNDLYDYLKDFYDDVFSNEFDLKKFKQLYYFYKNNNKFNLKYFVKIQIENINFEIYKTF